MNLLILGATGMVGHSVLRECLNADDVERVVALGRTPTGIQHPRLSELSAAKLDDLDAIAPQLAPFDACFYCLGVTSVGMAEPDYMRITYDMTLRVARLLARANPAMTFVYVTGAGTDSSERGSRMWARVKGRTENALLQLNFKAAYMFRPGIIQPLHAVRSKTALYRAAYAVAGPIFWLLHRFHPGALVTSAEIGQAMPTVARHGYPHPILEVEDIQNAARRRLG